MISANPKKGIGTQVKITSHFDATHKYILIIEIIELYLSQSNIGAWKGRRPCDHLLIVKSVINEVKKGKNSENFDIVCYDRT